MKALIASFLSIFLLQACSNVSFSMITANVDRDLPRARAEIQKVIQNKGLSESERNEQLFKALYLAAKWSFPLTQELLKQGVDVNYPNNNAAHFSAYEPLRAAVGGDKLEVARLLIQKGAIVNPPEPEYPLARAVYRKNSAMVELLLAYGANPNVGFPWGIQQQSLMQVASEYADTRIYQLLQSAGGVMKTTEAQLLAHLKPDYQAKPIYATLVEAIRANRQPLAAMLLSRHPEFNRPDSNGISLIRHAYESKAWDVLRWLAPQGNNVKPLLDLAIQNDDDEALSQLLDVAKPKGPLWALKESAINAQKANALKALLAYAPQVNKPAGETQLLMLAVKKAGTTHVLKTLLEAGADVDRNNIKKGYYTALAHAAYHHNNDYFANLLISYGGKGYVAGQIDASALYHAIRQKKADLAFSLAKQTNPLTQNQKNILYVESLVNQLAPTAAYLKQNGAQLIERQDSQGNGMIMRTLMQKDLQLLDEMLAAGLFTHEVNIFGDTLLHRASALGFLPAMERFLARGQNPLQKSNKGLTPLDYAIQYKKTSAIERLIPYYLEAGETRPLKPLLIESVQKSNTRLLTKLLAAGMSPNTTNYAKKTLLYLAVEAKASDETLKLLLAAGADPNKKVKLSSGGSYAMIEAAGNKLSHVKLLMAAGGNLNQPDDKGKTAMDHLIDYSASYCGRLKELRKLGGYSRKSPNFWNEVDSNCFYDDSNKWVAPTLAALNRQIARLERESRAAEKRLRATIRAGEAFKRQQQAIAKAKREMAQQAAAKPTPALTATSKSVAPAKPTSTQQEPKSRPATAKVSAPSVPKPSEPEYEGADKNSKSARWAGVPDSDNKKVNLEGSFPRTQLQIGDCGPVAISIRYRIGTTIGSEPSVGGKLDYELGEGTTSGCLWRKAKTNLYAWIKLQNGNSHGYVWLSGGSPNWNNFICGFEGNQRVNCFDKEQARAFLREAKVVGYELSLK